jgi:4-amino-4-deoxy-L-arabinose transferase-like glycosyltransferase
MDTKQSLSSGFQKFSFFSHTLHRLKKNRIFQVLVALTILGAFLRFFHLATDSFWGDEIVTLLFAQKGFVGAWEGMVAGEFNPPLFHWMEHVMLAFGDGEFVLRFIPALLGTLTIPVSFLIGREIMDRATGIITAALLTFSPFAITYSQEARAYAAMLFCFSLAFFFYLRGLRREGMISWILFGIFSGLAFWTHFYVFIPICILILFSLLWSLARKPALESLVGPGTGAGTFAVFSFPLWGVALHLFGLRTGGIPSFGNRGIIVIPVTLKHISGFTWITTGFALLLFVIGLFWLFFREGKQGISALLGASVGLPLVISVLLSYHMPMVSRYLIYLLPGYFSVVAVPIAVICRRFPNRRNIYAVILLIFLINLPYLFTYYTTLQKDDWRGFSGVLSSQTETGDFVVAIPSYTRGPLDYYYNSIRDGTLEYGVSTVPDLEFINAKRGRNQIFYVVTPYIQYEDPDGKVSSWLQEHTDPNATIHHWKEISLMRSL